MSRLSRWWNIFTTPGGDPSIARLQIAWGTLVLIEYSILPLLRTGAHRELPTSMFVAGLVVLIVGGIALVMEARIERVPDPALLPVLLGLRDGEGSGSRYWLDVAVLQLILGAVFVPLLLRDPALQTVGWRLVTITVVSEFVYLAFLSAQLVQKDELDAILREIQETKKRLAATGGDSDAPAEERLRQKKEQENALDLLRRRAGVLMQQSGRSVATAEQST